MGLTGILKKNKKIKKGVGSVHVWWHGGLTGRKMMPALTGCKTHEIVAGFLFSASRPDSVGCLLGFVPGLLPQWNVGLHCGLKYIPDCVSAKRFDILPCLPRCCCAGFQCTHKASTVTDRRAHTHTHIYIYTQAHTHTHARTHTHTHTHTHGPQPKCFC